ncbi:MAG TPA: hypothetical protein VIM12_00060 [Noviherbaspirillum sp.]|uniref:hypothetical protein n=1 Tax=Noviherbaspirillum sp. TaxID=1926288 RepID=UPI002F91C11F
MESGPDFELLKDAYAIIDGIPESAVDLTGLCTARGETLDQMVCSPAGWLARHPDFNRLGLTLAGDEDRLALNGDPAPRTTAEAMAQLFRLPLPEAEHLFGSRDTYTLGDDSGLSDKRLFLRELREFLRAHGQTGEEFEEQLETRAPFADPVRPDQLGL